jgi:hypothetical protein
MYTRQGVVGGVINAGLEEEWVQTRFGGGRWEMEKGVKFDEEGYWRCKGDGEKHCGVRIADRGEMWRGC